MLRYRARGALAVAAVLLAGTLLGFHHTDVAAGQPHPGMDMGAVAEMCVAALTAAGAAVLVVAVGLIALGRWRPPLLMRADGARHAVRAPLSRARAGPGLLLLLCVDRR